MIVFFAPGLIVAPLASPLIFLGAGVQLVMQ